MSALLRLRVLMEGLIPNRNVLEFKEGSQQEFEKRMPLNLGNGYQEIIEKGFEEKRVKRLTIL
jgi:hypothetical protein